MFKTIYAKIIGAMIAGLIVGGMVIVFFMTATSRDLANKTSQKSFRCLANLSFKR